MNDFLSGFPQLKPGDFILDPDALRVEEAKVVKYLLNLDSGVGWGKAKFFLAQGFSIEEWTNFADALRNHAESNPIAAIQQSEWGVKYVVECTIAAPKGDSYCIRVVWNHHEDGSAPRLITAHPLS